jgi:hypothetical protein
MRRLPAPRVRRNRGALLLVLLACCGAAAALPPSLRAVMERLPEAERARLAERQQRWSALDEAGRAALRQRIAEWDALPDAERRSRREGWQAWQALPHDERMRMREARARFDALPAAEQQALRERFDALDANLRRGWLLGPTLGADWPRLHALLAQVPDEAHAALLDALRLLSPQAREDLAVLAQRTPPEGRDALRAELLAQPVQARGPWLRRRVDP